MKIIFLIIVILMVAGCASTTAEDVEIVRMQTQQQAQLMTFHQSLASKPTYKIKCDAGCDFEIFDGDELPPLPKIDHFISANEANARMFESSMRVLPTITGWIAGASILSNAFDAAGGGNSTINNTSSINGDDNNIDPTTELSGQINTSSKVGDATNNSLNNAYNKVAEPTVVNQPDPVVVNPVVVNQPTPIVVNPSYPPK